MFSYKKSDLGKLITNSTCELIDNYSKIGLKVVQDYL